MYKAVKLIIGLGGVTVVIVALLHIVFGPTVIPGGMPVNATLDSEDRFYGAIFLAYGLALLWCVAGIEQKLHFVRFLIAAMFVGGLTRLISMLVVGLPHSFFIALTVIELGLPVIIFLLLSRSATVSEKMEPTYDLRDGQFSGRVTDTPIER